MNSIFLDADVTVDFLTSREPFTEAIMQIFNMSKDGQFRLFVSSLTVANAHYVIKKMKGRKIADQKIEILNRLVNVLNLGQAEVDRAIASKFTDFEDALQNYSALSGSMETIITRNTKDYKWSNLSVMTPAEFLKSYKI